MALECDANAKSGVPGIPGGQMRNLYPSRRTSARTSISGPVSRDRTARMIRLRIADGDLFLVVFFVAAVLFFFWLPFPLLLDLFHVGLVALSS